MRPDDFDVPRRSPYTPEGQIEAAGHFARGMRSRFGQDRLRRVVGRVALAAAVILIVVGIVQAL